MRRARRTPKLLVLLSAIVLAITLALPFGTSQARAAEVGEWIPSAYGQIRIESVSPVKELYQVGDVVTLQFRMESNAAAPARDVEASSATLGNAGSCTWNDFPGGTSGKYSCARTGLPVVTYTVTAADAAAGAAEFDLTFTEYAQESQTGPRTGDVKTSTITGSLAVEQPVEPLTSYPIGETDAAFAVGELGQIRLNRVNNAKAVYAVGDVLSLTYRYVTNTTTMPVNTPRSVTMSSETVDTNSSNVCAETYSGGNPLAGTCLASYTVTAADAAAGKATITTSWLLARTGEGAVSETIVHSSEVPVAPEPTPALELGE